MGDRLKKTIMDAAVLACNSHTRIGKAEFSVLAMKFSNNRVVKDVIYYLDKKISKMIDFDQHKSSFIENKSPFTQMIMHCHKEDDLVRDHNICKLQRAIQANVDLENKRVSEARKAKTEATVYKTVAEVLQIEKCYSDALALVAPEKATLGFSALEYCTMCIYYDSQPYPVQFIEACMDGPDEELDDILEDMQK